MLSLRPLRPWVRALFPAAVLTAASACGNSTSEPGTGAAAGGSDALVHLEARAVTPAGAVARASFQTKRDGAALTQELEVQVEKAPPGVAHPVLLGGHEVGRMVTDLDGEAELELGAEGERALPAGFVVPAAGSELRIGELVTLRLEPLERLVHLEANVDAGKVSGKVSYKVERLAGSVTREFKLKLSGLPKNSVQPLRIGANAVADLAVEADGKVKLEYSEADGRPFPAGFPAPEAGTFVHVGELALAELHDRLTAQSPVGSE